MVNVGSWLNPTHPVSPFPMHAVLCLPPELAWDGFPSRQLEVCGGVNAGAGVSSGSSPRAARDGGDRYGRAGCSPGEGVAGNVCECLCSKPVSIASFIISNT